MAVECFDCRAACRRVGVGIDVVADWGRRDHVPGLIEQVYGADAVGGEAGEGRSLEKREKSMIGRSGDGKAGLPG